MSRTRDTLRTHAKALISRHPHLRALGSASRRPLDRLEATLRAAAQRLTLRPTHPPRPPTERHPPPGPDTTIDVAWRSHPDAPAVFARHHLPHCDGCAVRFDETLAEAAEAYDLDLDRLLSELRALRLAPQR